MRTNEQTVEQWAETASFAQPVSFGEIEAGVLSRPPARSEGLGWSYRVIIVGIVAPALALALVLGPALALLGLGAVWLSVSSDPPGGIDLWKHVAHLIFVVGALTELSTLVELAKTRTREWFYVGTGALTVIGSAGAFQVLRSSEQGEIWGLTPAVVVMGLCGVANTVVPLTRKTRQPGPNADRKAPKRGPENDDLYWHYVRTRRMVLNTLVERGVVKVDVADQTRLAEMPLGYWEELDGVDEREWRRILEYRIIGWRTFTEADRRPWTGA